MRFHASLERARRTAKRLRDAVNHHRPSPVPLTLGGAQRCLAVAWGYADWTELGLRCEESGRSPFDEDSSPEVIRGRALRHAAAVASVLGLDVTLASAVVDSAALTARVPPGRAGREGKGDAESRAPIPHDGRHDHRFGVVLFDDPQDPATGWAAQVVEGRGASVRVGGIDELATDTLWLTNVAYDNFFRGRSELWRIPNLRHDRYLTVGHADMLREWGHDPTSVEADFVALFTAQLFDRIMRIAWSLLSGSDPSATMGRAFARRTLRHDLLPLLPPQHYPSTALAEGMTAGRGWEEFVATGNDGPKGGRWGVLRRPRVEYARLMLTTPLPFGHQRLVDLPTAGPLPVGILGEVSVGPMSRQAAATVGRGAAASHLTTRTWVTAREAEVLSGLAEVTYGRTWRPDGKRTLLEGMSEAVRAFMAHGHMDASWSAGVVAEALWRAALLPEDGERARSMGHDPAKASWQGFALRSADRAETLVAALRLTGEGHVVISHGLGWVRHSSSGRDFPKAVSDGMAAGLCPFLVDVPRGPSSLAGSLDAGTSPVLRAVAWGSTRELWQADLRALEAIR